MTKRISELFDYGDEIVVDGLESPFDPARIKEITMKKLHKEPPRQSRVRVRRVSRTLLLAAILSALFVTSALAVGLSIHSRRQAQLNETVAQGGSVAGYTEYAVPAAQEETSVTLLSALADGEFERIWLNVSPVEEDEVPRFMNGTKEEGGVRWYNIGVRVPGDEAVYGRADYLDMIAFEPGDIPEDGALDRELVERRYREQYYDGETKTLTVCLLFPQSSFETGRPVELTLSLESLFETDGRSVPITWSEECETLRTFGTLLFTPVEEETLRFFFPEPLVFENPETGDRGEVRGIELTASGVNSFVWHPDIGTVYEPGTSRIAEGQTELCLSWANAAERALDEKLVLHLADGSTASPVPTVACHVEDGLEKLISSGRVSLWDIHSVVSVTAGEHTWEIPGHN